jgi:putative hydrolase of the HAD superfamily
MVLIYPKSGNWTYPDGYFKHCLEMDIPGSSERQVENEKIAYAYINKIQSVTSINEEYGIFNEFYKMIFSDIDIKETAEFCSKITQEMVHNYNNYCLYDDVKKCLSAIHEKFRLGIISNAFPSLRNNYEAKGILKYFDHMVISSEHGMKKDDINLFIKALENIKEKPNECLFIDDSVENCRNAKKAGMFAVVMDRNSDLEDGCDFPVVNNLVDLANLLKG